MTNKETGLHTTNAVYVAQPNLHSTSLVIKKGWSYTLPKQVRDAMQMALEALELCIKTDTVEDMHMLETELAPKAFSALKEALN